MRVACVGILVADVVARPVDALPEPGSLGLVDEVSLHGGGCALNTGTALARLGADVVVGGKVGEDALGAFVLSLLDGRGLDRRPVLVDGAVPTSATVALVDSAGERTFLHVPGANGAVRLDELDEDALLAADALHVAGSLVMEALDGGPTAELLARARARGLHTSLDTVFDASGRWERVVPSLPHLDLFLASRAEAEGVTGTDDPAGAAAWLRREGAREVAIKLGADGCHVAADGIDTQVAPVAVSAVDGTGAGDAFAAGILYGRLAGWPLERAARLGNAVGALSTRAVGAAGSLPTLDAALAAASLETVA